MTNIFELMYIASKVARTQYAATEAEAFALLQEARGLGFDIPVDRVIFLGANDADPVNGYPERTVSAFLHRHPDMELKELLNPWAAYGVKINVASGAQTTKEYYYYGKQVGPIKPGLIGYSFDANGLPTGQIDYYFRHDPEAVIAEYGLPDPRPAGYVAGQWDTYGITFADDGATPVRLKLYVFPQHNDGQNDPLNFP